MAIDLGVLPSIQQSSFQIAREGDFSRKVQGTENERLRLLRCIGYYTRRLYHRVQLPRMRIRRLGTPIYIVCHLVLQRAMHGWSVTVETPTIRAKSASSTISDKRCGISSNQTIPGRNRSLHFWLLLLPAVTDANGLRGSLLFPGCSKSISILQALPGQRCIALFHCPSPDTVRTMDVVRAVPYKCL